MQDLKAGQLVGCTPWKQQVMQTVSLFLPAVAIPFALNLVASAYGIGPATASNPQSLSAPQATMMLEVSRGIFYGGLPSLWIAIGGGVALAVMVLDFFAEQRRWGFRIPILAFALGLYLPIEGESSLFAFFFPSSF
jgi:putative OPT family oligopeptide transporter